MKHDIRTKKLFLLDMDGTIYLGDELFDGTLDFLDYVKKSGGRYMFLTNNSSKGLDKYVEKLARLGIAATEDDFLSSAQATSLYLHKHHAGQKLYVLGTESFKDYLRGDGHCVTDVYAEDIDVLVMGYDTELVYRKLVDACLLLKRDIPYIATNPDWVCPTEWGYVPDCGSVATMLQNATGKWPRFIGKPEPAMIELAVEKAGYAKEDALMIGDRVYTDIAGGVNAGIATAFVLSGEGTMADVEASDKKPTFVYENIRAIYNALVGE